jgi:FixJ family two-component response regulator
MDAKNKTKEPLVSIVDDDVSVRRSTRRLLRCCGLRAEVFPSAEDFLQSGLAAETTCLLLDVRMPKMDGLELQRRLGETGRYTQVPLTFCANPSAKRLCCAPSVPCSKFQSITNVKIYDYYYG